MKKKVGELYDKPIVIGNPNEFTKQEISLSSLESNKDNTENAEGDTLLYILGWYNDENGTPRKLLYTYNFKTKELLNLGQLRISDSDIIIEDYKVTINIYNSYPRYNLALIAKSTTTIYDSYSDITTTINAGEVYVAPQSASFGVSYRIDNGQSSINLTGF